MILISEAHTYLTSTHMMADSKSYCSSFSSIIETNGEDPKSSKETTSLPRLGVPFNSQNSYSRRKNNRVMELKRLMKKKMALKETYVLQLRSGNQRLLRKGTVDPKEQMKEPQDQQWKI